MRGLGPMSIPNVVDILDSVKCYINIVSKGKIIIIIKTYQKGPRHVASQTIFVIDGTTMVAVVAQTTFCHRLGPIEGCGWCYQCYSDGGGGNHTCKLV